MSGSIRKHIAKDGDVTWRVRIEFYDDRGKRHQPQRTFATKAEAQDGLREWVATLGLAGKRHRGEDRFTRELRMEIPPGTWSCLQAIALEARELQWRWQTYTPARVTHLLRYIEACAQAGLSNLTPQPAPAGLSLGPDLSHRGVPGGYYVYRLLADGVPFYVGQSRDVLARVRAHVSQATTPGRAHDRSARANAVRQALAEGKTVTFDVVATAPTPQEIRELERQWILRLISDGYTLANGAAL